MLLPQSTFLSSGSRVGLLRNMFVFKALSDFFFLQKSLPKSIFWHPHYFLARSSTVQTKQQKVLNFPNSWEVNVEIRKGM